MWRLRDFLFDIKMFFQKVFRGYSDLDIWNLDCTILAFIGPRVKALRNMTHGYPAADPEIPSFEEWCRILDDIAFACDMYPLFGEFVNISSQEDYDCFKKVWEQYPVSDTIPSFEDVERANRGLWYLKKYLLCLWD